MHPPSCMHAHARHPPLLSNVPLTPRPLRQECTARVVVHRELSLVTSYTLEASFCGCDERRERHNGGNISSNAAAQESAPAADERPSGEGAGEEGAGAPATEMGGGASLGGGFHFTTAHFLQFGFRFCRALHVYFGLGAPANDGSTREKIEELSGLSVSQLEMLGQLPNNPSVHAALTELLQGAVDDVDGGDSEGSDGGDASGGEEAEATSAAPAAPAAPTAPASADAVCASSWVVSITGYLSRQSA